MNNNVQLIDGWLSPRMRHMLTLTAGFEEDIILQCFDVDFGSDRRAAPLSECCDPFGGLSRIEYIPTGVLESPENRNGLYKSFNDGWGCVWRAILTVLERGQAPTVHNVERCLAISVGLPGHDIGKYQHFLSKGGRVEFAIDALIKITQNVVENGDDGWEYEMHLDDIEEFPASYMDRAFDIARVKCIQQGGGEVFLRGPYRHDRLCPVEIL